MLIVLLSALTGCGVSTASVKDLNIPRPNVTLITPTPEGTLIPEKELSQSETEKYWGRDRQSLLVCRMTHKGLADYTTSILDQLEGVKK